MINTLTDINFEIVKHICIINNYETGWTKELNIVKWNSGPEKYDIRDWNVNHEHMSRGITLTAKEVNTMLNGILSSGEYEQLSISKSDLIDFLSK